MEVPTSECIHHLHTHGCEPFRRAKKHYTADALTMAHKGAPSVENYTKAPYARYEIPPIYYANPDVSLDLVFLCFRHRFSNGLNATSLEKSPPPMRIELMDISPEDSDGASVRFDACCVCFKWYNIYIYVSGFDNWFNLKL